ncbi:uncharacterized protein [Eurosta solidaginis]|uniref:uncharacterized protein n=1 Tax=Eurosta solidaginis TaxID=178769 RepID=UPI0035313D6C
MGGSRSYSVSSTCSGSSTSGNYSTYSPSGSEQLTEMTATNKLIYKVQRGKADGAEGTVEEAAITRQAQQQPDQRVWSQLIMCRCCLSEKLEPKMRQAQDSSSEPVLGDEEAPLLIFVPLDTLAMVDLREDNYTNSPLSGYNSSDSYKANASARNDPSANRGGRRIGVTTKTTAMNNKKVNSTLLDCLKACARIGASAEDIELPQHICLDCCHTLEMCCEFIRCVRNADKILRRRCALPTKRFSPQDQQQKQQLQQHQALIVGRSGVYDDEEAKPPAVKRRRRRAEQEYRLSVARVGANEKSFVNNTPKSVSLPKSGPAPRTSAVKDQLLDITISLDGVENKLVRSFDSGIEFDEDLSSVKSSDASSANENSFRYHLEKYEGYTYVVAETLSHDLERFHRSERKHAGTCGKSVPSSSTTYKCGFCIYECTVRQELNKHLQKHLGPPQHSCRQCNFVGHFKFLLLQHMRNVHRCTVEVVGASQQEVKGAAASENAMYNCHLCDEYFVNYDALQQHRKSHKVFCQCTICTFKSSTRESILEHLAKEHKVLVDRRLMVKYIPLQRTNGEQDLSPNENKSQHTDLEVLPKDRRYRIHLCQFCGKCFERRFHLLKHEYGVHRDEQKNGVDAGTQTKLLNSSTSSKYQKLKYLRQRNAVQEARQQRRAKELELLDEQEPGKDITSKFKCAICSAMFMFNFELKYHMRTHKPGGNMIGAKLGWNNKDSADKRNTNTPKLPKAAASLAVDVVESKTKLEKVMTKECAVEQFMEVMEVVTSEGVVASECNAATDVKFVDGDQYYYYYDGGNVNVVAESHPNTMDGAIEFTHADLSEISNPELLQALTDDINVDLDLMLLVPPDTSQLDANDASPTTNNNSFDINYDDQLYLNDFDLGLLDCNGGYEGL